MSLFGKKWPIFMRYDCYFECLLAGFMTLQRVYFLLLFIGLLSGVGAGLYVFSAYEQEGGIFKHRLLDFFFYPAFVLLGLYSSLFATTLLAKTSIGLQLPPLGEIHIANIGNGARRFFYIVYMSIGSVLAPLIGYGAGVIWTIFFGRIFL